MKSTKKERNKINLISNFAQRFTIKPPIQTQIKLQISTKIQIIFFNVKQHSLIFSPTEQKITVNQTNQLKRLKKSIKKNQI